jgi:hypothetical protein
MCPKCHVKLTPIIYGTLNPDLIDMQNQGKIIIGSGKYKKGKPLSICISCEETYETFTSID